MSGPVPPVRVVLLADGDALDRLCGISPLERLLRMLERCDVEDVTLLSSEPERLAALPAHSWARPRLRFAVAAREHGTVRTEHIAAALSPQSEGARVLVLPAAATYDARLLGAMLACRAPTVLVDSAPPEDLRPLLSAAQRTPEGLLCGPALLDAAWCANGAGPLGDCLAAGLADGSLAPIDVAAQPAYWPGLRRALRPFWFPAPAPALRARAERTLVDATQKGAQDLPAMLHAPIEKWLVSRLCRTAITPNQITLLVNFLAWTATALFATGQLGFATALALVVGVLDGVDGKQARLKVETSPFGRLEHLFDSLFEYSWWLALGFHFESAGLIPHGMLFALVLIAADLIDMAAAGVVLWRLGRTMDDLTPGDRAFRLVAGRRNIYVFMLAGGLLLGSAAGAFQALVGWAVLTAALRTVRTAGIVLPQLRGTAPARAPAEA